jgi:hypothetical protein
MTKLHDIRPQARNANKHTQRGMAALEQSIQQDGWIGAITVAADGETFDGSARIETAAASGFDDPIVVETDGSRPVILKRTDIPNADDPRAMRLGLAANRVAQTNLEWDTDVLASLGESIDLSQFWLEGELANLMGEGIDADEMWKGMPEFEQDNLSWKHITVHFASEQDYNAFSRLIDQTLTPRTTSVWYPQQASRDVQGYRVEDES